MCGIVGIYRCNQPVAPMMFDAMTALQHRGQDACGMMVMSDQKMYGHRGPGLVRDVFDQRIIDSLRGEFGIGHLRYGTTGGLGDGADLAQPFYVNVPRGMALVHNGQLVDAERLTREMIAFSPRTLATTSDSELLLNLFSSCLEGGGELQVEQIATSVRHLMDWCPGIYSSIVLLSGFGLVAFRDAWGVRPLVWGQRLTSAGKEYMVASETGALEVLGFEYQNDLAPGSMLCIDLAGNMSILPLHQSTPRPCLFEYIYLARSDARINHISVYQARWWMGVNLAKQLQVTAADYDMVVPVPYSSNVAASALAAYLNIPYHEAIVKNRYIGRTFIMADAKKRQHSVAVNINPVQAAMQGKKVLLVDDSVVRGTTCRQVIQLCRQAGATKVGLASTAPPVLHPNLYGIDIPSRRDLLAHNKSIAEIQAIVGADDLWYQNLPDLIDAVRQAGQCKMDFEDSVFTGHYPIGHIDEAYLDAWELKRQLERDERPILFPATH